MGDKKDNVTFFAKIDYRNKKTRFGIKRIDRERHVYIIGKTGVGKSTVLENMAVQDVQNGEGMAFLDPHGSSAEVILEYIPENRLEDVLYFAPFDMENPISFNVMEDIGRDQRHLVVSGLMSTFKKIWQDAWSARMEYILANTILALLETPESTLLGVNRMLADKEYRKIIIGNIKDPSVKSFWVDEYLKWDDRYAREAGAAIQNKIGQFVANPLIRNIIGQPKSSFDIRKLMDDRKIFIMNLSKGRIGEQNMELLGGMLITKVYLAAMSRADLPVRELKSAPSFYFYVDEFQNFANESFASILSEARKYKLNLTIANQYIAQMEEEVRDAVFGNVGTTISFRVGPFDAEVIEKIFLPTFTQDDLVNLAAYQIYLTLMVDGLGSKPFSATTLPPLPLPEVNNSEQVKSNSRRIYSKKRIDVENEIDKWHEPVVAPKNILSGGDVKKPPAWEKKSFSKPAETKPFVKKEEEKKYSKPIEKAIPKKEEPVAEQPKQGSADHAFLNKGKSPKKKSQLGDFLKKLEEDGFVEKSDPKKSISLADLNKKTVNIQKEKKVNEDRVASDYSKQSLRDALAKINITDNDTQAPKKIVRPPNIPTSTEASLDELKDALE